MNIGKFKLSKLLPLIGILLFIFVVSMMQYPYKSETILEYKTGDLLEISGKMYSIVDIKQTRTESSIHYFLHDGNDFFVVSFKRFPYWNQYAASPIMSMEDGIIYEYNDYYSKGEITRNGKNFMFTEQKYVSWHVFPPLLALVAAAIPLCRNDKDRKN